MSGILLREETEDGIRVLTLNRPEAMNCFNFDLLAALANTIREANFDMDLLCIIITGAGGEDPKKTSFSTGADLKERRTLSPDQARRFIFTIRNTFTAVEQVRVPVIAAINFAVLNQYIILLSQPKTEISPFDDHRNVDRNWDRDCLISITVTPLERKPPHGIPKRGQTIYTNRLIIN